MKCKTGNFLKGVERQEDIEKVGVNKLFLKVKYKFFYDERYTF